MTLPFDPAGFGVINVLQLPPTYVAEVEGISDKLDTIIAALPTQVYSNATRPAANSVGQGKMIWNSDDKAPNWAGGPADNNWYDASGDVT